MTSEGYVSAGREGREESLEGMLQRERVEGTAPRSLAGAMALLEPVVHALSLSHARGVGHRDIRPGSIYFVVDSESEGGYCATLAPSSMTDVLDNPAAAPYRAPEQFSEAFGIAGPWTDVFALAVILVTLLSGEEPVGGSPDLTANPFCSPRRIAPHARISNVTDEVLVRALSVYPAERWQTVQSFWDALRAAQEIQPLAAA